MKKCILILLLSALSCKAQNPWSTGNALLQATEYDIEAQKSAGTPGAITTERANTINELRAFLFGFIDSAELTTLQDKATLPFLIPGDASIQQVVKVVHQYLEEHPEMLDIHGPLVLFKALTKAFPNPNFKS